MLACSWYRSIAYSDASTKACVSRASTLPSASMEAPPYRVHLRLVQEGAVVVTVPRQRQAVAAALKIRQVILRASQRLAPAFAASTGGGAARAP